MTIKELAYSLMDLMEDGHSEIVIEIRGIEGKFHESKEIYFATIDRRTEEPNDEGESVLVIF